MGGIHNSLGLIPPLGFSKACLRRIKQDIVNVFLMKIQIRCFHWSELLKRRRATIKANDPIESSMAGIVIARPILHKIDHDSFVMMKI